MPHLFNNFGWKQREFFIKVRLQRKFFNNFKFFLKPIYLWTWFIIMFIDVFSTITLVLLVTLFTSWNLKNILKHFVCNGKVEKPDQTFEFAFFYLVFLDLSNLIWMKWHRNTAVFQIKKVPKVLFSKKSFVRFNFRFFVDVLHLLNPAHVERHSRVHVRKSGLCTAGAKRSDAKQMPVVAHLTLQRSTRITLHSMSFRLKHDYD